jgi:hypothetical protein
MSAERMRQRIDVFDQRIRMSRHLCHLCLNTSVVKQEWDNVLVIYGIKLLTSDKNLIPQGISLLQRHMYKIRVL